MKYLFFSILYIMPIITLTSCSSKAEAETGIYETVTDSLHYEIYSEELSFTNNGGQYIYGTLYMPVNKSGRIPVVILSHGYGETYRSVVAYAHALAEHGYASYCFDFRGGSLSSRSDGYTTEMSIFTEEQDLSDVLQMIRNQSFTDTDNIFLFGASQGGMVSAMAAADHIEQIRGLVLFYPALCIHDDMTEMYPDFADVPSTVNFMGMVIGRPYFEDLYDFDTYGYISRYDKHVLIVHGNRDGIVPLSYSEQAVEAYPSAELKVINGAGHGFGGKEQSLAIEYLLDYMHNLIKRS